MAKKRQTSIRVDRSSRDNPKKYPFIVTIMKQEDFYNLSELRDYFKQIQQTALSSMAKLDHRAENQLRRYN